MPLDVLAAARSRIKKDKHRVMSLRAGKLPPLDAMVRDGLAACRDGLLGANAVGGSKTNFSLEALRVWGTRLTARARRRAGIACSRPARGSGAG